MNKFSERLKEFRKEKDMSQSQPSKATGLSHAAIVYWETEQRVLSENIIITLAGFFRHSRLFAWAVRIKSSEYFISQTVDKKAAIAYNYKTTKKGQFVTILPDRFRSNQNYGRQSKATIARFCMVTHAGRAFFV